MASKKKITRVKNKTQNRSFPMFDKKIEKTQEAKEEEENLKATLVRPPETSMDIARLLADEIKKKWADAQIPMSMSGKHLKLMETMLQEFSSDSVRSMIRILVWDFDEIKKNKGFFPTSSHLSWPWLDQLYNYRHALASVINTGITDSTSRVSVYAQKYLNKPSEGTEKLSMKDKAKKMLGQ